MKLDEFKDKAKNLGAAIEETPAYKNREQFDIWHSPEYGGCGEQGCSCSPGLWISGAQEDKVITAHFGTDWRRGGAGRFTKDDYKNWCELVDYAAHLKKRR